MTNRKNVVKAVVLVAVLGVLIFFSSSWPIATVRNLALKILKPVVALAGRFSRVTPVAAEEETLQQMVVRFELETLRQENARFRQALSLRDTVALPVRGFGVVSYFREFGNEFLLLEEGSEAGIRTGNIVLDHYGFVVGFVHEVGDRFAKVAIASNVGNAFESELIPGLLRVLVKSVGGRTFSLEFLPVTASIRTGDFVGVVQSDGGARKTFLLAEVRESVDGPEGIFKEARAVLVARPEILDTVFVISS